MANPTRLSATPPISDPNSSSQCTSLTLTGSSDEVFHSPGPTICGPWLEPNQAACQHTTSDRQSPTPSGVRLPASSHENKDDEGAHDSIEASTVDARADSMHGSGGKSHNIPARGYSRITQSPLASQSQNTESGKLLKRVRHDPESLPETLIESPRTTNIFNLWKWEILNCVLAIGVIGFMHIILLHYDGEPVPDWGPAINLSTMIALMATIIRTMLVFVASEIVGQAKWNHLASGRRPGKTIPVRRLIETSRFNDATQGLLGAIKLLPTIIRDPMTLTAVTVMVVSLGTGSFVQQAIQTQSCQFPVGGAHAFLPISRNITGYVGESDSFTEFFGPTDLIDVQAALSSALAPDSEEIGSPIAFMCSTGNCTFDNSLNSGYSTLGVCSSCADTSSLISSTRREAFTDTNANATYSSRTDYTLADGKLVHAHSQPYSTELLVSAELGLDWAGDLVSGEMKALSRWAFADITIFSSNWLPTSLGYTDYVAATCTLYTCLRSYKASVLLGKLDDILLDTIPAVPNVAALASPETTIEEIQQAIQESKEQRLQVVQLGTIAFELEGPIIQQAIQSPCLVNNTIWTKENKSSSLEMQRVLLIHADSDPSGGLRFTIENITAPEKCIYGMDAAAESLFANVAAQVFNGTCSAFLKMNEEGRKSFSIMCDTAYWLARFYNHEGTTAATIIKQIEAFTDRLTNKMRNGLVNDPETVSGQALQMTVCSRIQYSWLAFPAALVAVTNGLLAWAMWQSHRRRGRVMVWKTSILPFMFYGEQFVVQNAEDVSVDRAELSQRGEGAREPLLDLDQMEAEAKQRKVRFEAFD